MIHYNLIRKIFILVIILSLCFSFFYTSSSSKKLDNLAYIVSIGIDKGKTQTYKISFQISTVQAGSSGEIKKKTDSNSNDSKNEENNNYIVNTIECSSIDYGIGLINTYVNKKVSLSHCKVILVSEELAKEGISDIVYTLVNKVEIRPDCNIIISRVFDEDFKNSSKPTIEDVLLKYYDIASGHSEKETTQYTQIIRLTEFYSFLQDPICSPYTTLGIVTNPKFNSRSNTGEKSEIDKTASEIVSENDEPTVELYGLSVFKGDKLVGTLNGMETICHLMATDNLSDTTISIPSPFNTNSFIDLNATMNKAPKIKVYINHNSSPYITIDLNIITRLLSFNSNESNVTQEQISQIESVAKKYITEQLYNYFNKTAKTFKSDIDSFGDYAAKNFLTEQELSNYNWEKNYESSAFNINVNLTLKSGYLLTNK